jgi:serine/threonine-protein kinase RsbW
VEILAGRALRWAVREIRRRSRMRPHPTAPQATPEPRSLGVHCSRLADPFEVTLAAEVDAPAAARAAVTAWMTGHVSETMLTDAQLLVSELVANSVRHAEAPADALISVRAQMRADVLCLEVQDGGTSGAIVHRAPDLSYGGGFGLNVVEVLSRRWGVDRDAGTRVWAELALPAAG